MLLLAACDPSGGRPPVVLASLPPGTKALDPGFLWAVAVGGHQGEGGDTTSNYARWETTDPKMVRVGRSADFWNRYAEDFDLAKGLGCNTVRLSVEWSRIQPAPDRWDDDAVARYRAMFDALAKRNLQPIVTLHHWAVPAWVDDQGGWTDARSVDAYETFVRRVVRDVAPQAKLWLTFAEPNVWLAKDYLWGLGPTGRHSMGDFRAAVAHVLWAHGRAYAAIHAAIPDAKVSAASFHWQFGDPFGPEVKPLALLPEPFRSIATMIPGLPDDWFFKALQSGVLPFTTTDMPEQVADQVRGSFDFVGLDYYWTLRPWEDLSPRWRPWLLAHHPEHLEEVLLDLATTYGKPVLIAENGMATENGNARIDGTTRQEQLAATVFALRRAVHRGASVLGYTYWSLTDNYEWGSFSPRFGLYRVECLRDPSLTRHPTAAVETYRQLIRLP